MATIQFKNQDIHTAGDLPAKGQEAPSFSLTAGDLSEKSLAAYKGRNLILNIFPSINTPVCAQSVRQFNKDAASLENATVLCISADLPFAQAQFCGAEKIDQVETLSGFRSDFGKSYGVLMTDGPLRGLYSRAVVVIDPSGKIIYQEQVPDIAQEPNYKEALAAVN